MPSDADVSFRDILSFAIGGGWGQEQPNEKECERVRVVRGTDIPSVHERSFHDVPTRFESTAKVGKRRLRPGDIVLEISGGSSAKGQPTGRTVFIDEEVLEGLKGDAIPASFCRLVRVDDKRILPQFAYYWLQDMYVSGRAFGYEAQSTGISNFQFERFLDAERLTLPSIAEQQDVVDVLSAIEGRQRLLRRTNATLDSIAQSLFKSWFIDFDPVHAKVEGREPEGMDAVTAALFPAEFEETPIGLIPKGWSAQPFGALLDFTIGGDWGNETASSDCTLPATIIRGTDIPEILGGRYQAIPRRFVSPKKALKRRLGDGDLVIEVSGGSKTQPTGRSLYVTRDLLAKLGDAVVPTSFCRLFRARDAQTALLLSRHLVEIYRAGKTWNYQVQSTGLANFQTQHFLDAEMVVIPQSTILQRYFDVVRPLLDRIYAAPIAELEVMRNALLPRLVSGKIRTTNPQIILDEAIA